MGIKSKRAITKMGGSRGITLPSQLVMGKKATVVANRIVLVDPRGKISEDELLDFFETHVEPEFFKRFEPHSEEAKKNESIINRRETPRKD